MNNLGIILTVGNFVLALWVMYVVKSAHSETREILHEELTPLEEHIMELNKQLSEMQNTLNHVSARVNETEVTSKGILAEFKRPFSI
jgi:F0F1-type ATP synthase membrane subunit b/b'